MQLEQSTPSLQYRREFYPSSRVVSSSLLTFQNKLKAKNPSRPALQSTTVQNVHVQSENTPPVAHAPPFLAKPNFDYQAGTNTEASKMLL